MRIAVFLNGLGLGGSEKAATRWAVGLRDRSHDIAVITLADGPRRGGLANAGIKVHVLPIDADEIATALREISPDVIHAHVPGHPHKGDILGEALTRTQRIRVLSTNIFGQFLNPREDDWTDFRLFISWTSCVQAARRSFQRLDENFFRRASVAVYPLDPDDGPSQEDIAQFRSKHGIEESEVLFGRLSRPEPNKWTDLPISSLRIAARNDPRIRLLLREPPPSVTGELQQAPDRARFIILPATTDPVELALTTASLDGILHTSSVGESFGYGIAEAMNYAKPVIANSTPWQDQAQIELVRHGECGFIASTPEAIANRMLELAANVKLRARLGANARTHIRRLADPAVSLDRLEMALESVVAGNPNPNVEADVAKAREVAAYLDKHQFGHSWQEQLALRPLHYRVRFSQLRYTIASGFTR